MRFLRALLSRKNVHPQKKISVANQKIMFEVVISSELCQCAPSVCQIDKCQLLELKPNLQIVGNGKDLCVPLRR